MRYSATIDRIQTEALNRNPNLVAHIIRNATNSKYTDTAFEIYLKALEGCSRAAINMQLHRLRRIAQRRNRSQC